MLSIVMLNIVMLSVIMLSVVMLSAVAPDLDLFGRLSFDKLSFGGL